MSRWSAWVAACHRFESQWRTLGDLRGDGVLYGLSALFAIGMWLGSATVAESHWGSLSAWGYGAAALVAGACSLRSWRSPNVVRTVLAGLVLVLCVLMPLAVEAHWRQESQGTNFAQPEVMVIERAGLALVHGNTPYQASWNHGHLEHELVGVPTYESFDPYLPLMGAFGLPAGELSDHNPLGDARVIMTALTMACVALALWLLRLRHRAALRVVQFMVVLPTGAMFLVTGGDDMPILGLMLLTVALLQRRRPTTAGVVIAIAAAMKFTAWPLAFGALLVARTVKGTLVWRRIALIVMGLVLATTVPYALMNTHAFIDNVLLFPAGLAHVPSPAASDFPGHLLTVLWAPLGKALQVLVLASGYFFIRYLRGHWPIDVARLLSVLAVASALVIGAATATRFGYVIYPLNLWLWSRTLREAGETTPVLAK